MPLKKTGTSTDRLDRVVADARRNSAERETTYRERALKLLPWICTRCAREFPASRLRELTVHHKDGNHHHNPRDGSNWELLCLYCHDNEHQRYLEASGTTLSGEDRTPGATQTPFADLAALLRKD